jgi:competence protein ComEC
MLKGVERSLSSQLQVVLWGFVAGVAIAPLFLFVPAFVWQGMLGVLLLIASGLTLMRYRKVALVFVVMAAVSFGGMRFAQNWMTPDGSFIGDYVERSVKISGEVVREVERRPDGQQATFGNVRVDDHAVDGKLLVFFDTFPRLEYGSRAVFRCELSEPEPFSGFAYDTYLAVREIYAICYRPADIDVREGAGGFAAIGAILEIKTTLLERVKRILPEPHAGFVSGLLFGGSSTLPDTLTEDFSETGTSHILAASGFNVSLFSFLLLGWLIRTPLGRKRGLLVTGLLVGAYVVAAGADPAVVRAAVMAGLLLLAQWVGRRADTARILVVTLALMLLWEPRWLLFDVGFQLSFIATYAVLVVAPYWERHFTFLPKTLGLREALVGSLAAIVFTLPIVLWQFEMLPVVAPLVNVLILPFVPYLMALAGVGIVMGVWLPAAWVGVPAWALSTAVLLIVRWFGALPFASLSVPHPNAWALISAGVLCWYVFKNREALRSQTVFQVN